MLYKWTALLILLVSYSCIAKQLNKHYPRWFDRKLTHIKNHTQTFIPYSLNVDSVSLTSSGLSTHIDIQKTTMNRPLLGLDITFSRYDYATFDADVGLSSDNSSLETLSLQHLTFNNVQYKSIMIGLSKSKQNQQLMFRITEFSFQNPLQSELFNDRQIGLHLRWKF